MDFDNSTVRLSMGVLPYLPDTYNPGVDRNVGTDECIQSRIAGRDSVAVAPVSSLRD